MALNSTDNRISYAGNGVTTAFSFPYYFLQDADLVVIVRIEATGVETTQILNTDYTVSGEGNPSGGTVTMTTAPAAGRSLIIYRDPAQTQDLDLVENDPLPAEELEKRLDKLTMMVQRLNDRLDRGVTLTDGYTATFDPRLPTIFDPLQVLRFNAAGDGFEAGDQAAFAFDAAAPTTTKGDLIVHDGTSNVRFPAGANGTILSPDSSLTEGIGYKTAIQLSLATYTGAETLTNKTLTAPILTTPRFDDYTDWEEVTTPANPSAGYRRLYVKSDGKLYGLDSLGNETLVSGGGAGGINYISNPDAEASATGWAVYADAAATTPVNGTGGSPTVTITRVTSTPLRGLGMFRLTKDAANRQGEGVSYDFTIANSDKAQPINISFEYAVSANFVSGSDSTLGDLNVYIYDVTNSQVIQPTPFKLVGGTGNNHKFSGRFQAASNSTSYRLILHIAGTTATAWTFDFDNVVVGPQILLQTAAESDWVAYTPTITGFGTVSAVSVYSRRAGDTLEVHGTFTAGTVAATTASISLGYQGANGNVTADTTKVGTNKQILGGAGVDLNSGSAFGWEVVYGTTSAVYLGIQSSTNPAINTPTDGDVVATTGNVISFYFKIPISGWASNVLVSQDSDTRAVAVTAKLVAASQSIPDATNTVIVFDTANFDTHAAYSTSTGRFTAPVAGIYKVHAAARFATNGTGERLIYLRVNGSASVTELEQDLANGSFPIRINGAMDVKLNAGDYVEILAYQNSGGALNVEGSADPFTYLNISRVSGPALPVAGETVACFAHAVSTMTTLVDTVFTKINFTTVDFDTHGAFSTANDRYTAPMSGIYEVISQVRLDGGSTANETQSSIYKNGVEFIRTNKQVAAAGDGIIVQGLLNLVAGDYIEIFVQSNAGANRTTSSVTTKDTNFSIKKVA